MSRKSIILHVFAALLVLAFFIVSRMLAAIVFNQLRPLLPFVSFGEVSGSLWQGSVANLAVRHGTVNLVLGYTRWQASPWSLLAGSLSLHLQAENGKQTVDGDIRVGLDQSLHVADAEIVAPAALISQFYPVPGQIDGQFEVSLQELVLGADGMSALQGTGVYRDARYTLAEPIELGTFAARFLMENDVIKADLDDIEAQVGLNGSVTFAQKTRAYELDVKLLPAATANPIIGQSLEQFFQKAPDGSFQVRRSGQI